MSNNYMNSVIHSILPEINQIRRELHEIPELAFQEFRTTGLIRTTLESWGIHFHHFDRIDTGGYCDVGEGEGLAFRADIDALGVDENKDNELCSGIPGMMHACGHDFHITFGLGLARLLKMNENAITGRVRIIFQPAEEAAPGGAGSVAKEDIFQDISAILTMHVFPDGETGDVFLKEGPCCASSTTMNIRFSGPGGHTSRPNETADLIRIAGKFIVEMPEHLRMHLDPRETFALAFGEIKAGSAHNIIPQELTLRGTLRTFTAEVSSALNRSMQEFTQAFAAMHGCGIELSFPSHCPPVVNDKELADKFRFYMGDAGLDQHIKMMPKPSMGADDFSFYLDKFPGLYFLLGSKGRGVLHSGDLIIDEGIIEPALTYLYGYVRYLLSNHS